MGFVKNLLTFALLAVISAVTYQVYMVYLGPLPAPKLDETEYWGPGIKSSYKEDKSIKPFKISYSKDVILDLQQTLGKPLTYPEPLEGTNFEYGFNSRKLKDIVKYWKDDYLPRWSERETFLNKFNHFETQIQGLRIHYIHQKLNENVKRTKVVYPILLLHGWPGSVREFYDIIPKFTTPSNEHDYVFEIVAPSLPGYGWSQGPSKPGFGPAQIAVVLRNLMIRLGYNKFYIQAGDWGSLIGSNIATLYPENVNGYHTNDCIAHMSLLGTLKLVLASIHPEWFMEKEHTDFIFPITDKFSFLMEELGYMHIQATKPDTIGISLANNPVGLAAYILEKFSTWTDPNNRKLSDGGLGKEIKIDALLDNVMIYYLTNSITTSQRLYAEGVSKKQMALSLARVPTRVQTGCARFKNNLMHNFDWQLTDKYVNLVHSTWYKNGGHFPAMQLPDVLYKDFIEFIKQCIVIKKKFEYKGKASSTPKPST